MVKSLNIEKVHYIHILYLISNLEYLSWYLRVTSTISDIKKIEKYNILKNLAFKIRKAG